MAEADPLARSAQTGDRAAFEALVRREKAGLYAFVRRYVGDADEAYDIAQDAFIAAWRALPRYDPGRSFAVWLKTIALNKCRDHGRRKAVRRLVQRAFAAEPKAPAERDDAVIDDRMRRLDAAIAALPAFYKEPLLLVTSGGLSQAEAARALNTSAKAVEMRVRRARALLATTLADKREG